MTPEEKIQICDEILDRFANLSNNEERDEQNIFLKLGELESQTMELKLLYKQIIP